MELGLRVVCFAILPTPTIPQVTASVFGSVAWQRLSCPELLRLTLMMTNGSGKVLVADAIVVLWLLMFILSLARFRVCRCSAFGDSRLALWSFCSSFHCCPQFAWLGSGILQLSVLRRTSSDPRTLQRPHLFATDRLARFRHLATYSLAAASLGVHTTPG